MAVTENFPGAKIDFKFCDGNWIAPATLTGCPARVAPIGQTKAGLPIPMSRNGQKHLARFVPLTPVRSQSAFPKESKCGLGKWIALKHLGRRTPFSVRFQSALLGRVAENRTEHFSCRGHAIPADCMSIEL